MKIKLLTLLVLLSTNAFAYSMEEMNDFTERANQFHMMLQQEEILAKLKKLEESNNYNNLYNKNNYAY